MNNAIDSAFRDACDAIAKAHKLTDKAGAALSANASEMATVQGVRQIDPDLLARLASAAAECLVMAQYLWTAYGVLRQFAAVLNGPAWLEEHKRALGEQEDRRQECSCGSCEVCEAGRTAVEVAMKAGARR
jgi:hypothetical protein